MELQFISKNKDGNYYAVYRTDVKRGIHGKDTHASELIIIGIPKTKIKDFCASHNIGGINEINKM